jgi:hypothetical protein
MKTKKMIKNLQTKMKIINHQIPEIIVINKKSAFLRKKIKKVYLTESLNC